MTRRRGGTCFSLAAHLLFWRRQGLHFGVFVGVEDVGSFLCCPDICPESSSLGRREANGFFLPLPSRLTLELNLALPQPVLQASAFHLPDQGTSHLACLVPTLAFRSQSSECPLTLHPQAACSSRATCAYPGTSLYPSRLRLWHLVASTSSCHMRKCPLGT